MCDFSRRFLGVSVIGLVLFVIASFLDKSSPSTRKWKLTNAPPPELRTETSVSLCDTADSCSHLGLNDSLLQTLRHECSAFQSHIPDVHSPLSSGDGLVANDFTRSPVCIHRSQIYGDDFEFETHGIAVQRQPYPQRAAMRHITNFTTTRATSIRLHRTMSVVILDAIAGTNLYHLIADNLLPLVWLLYGNPTSNSSALRSLPRSFIFLTDEQHWKPEKKCRACTRVAEAVAPLVMESSMNSSETQCFCAALFNSIVLLPWHQEMFKNRERSIGTKWLRESMTHVFAADKIQPSQGSATSTKDALLKYLFNGAPRLLLVQRRSRSIGPIEAIHEAAKGVGFDVVLAFFEDIDTDTQYRLARDADVFVSIHGMALTWAFAMNGTSEPESVGCRTVIELRHFVRPFPPLLQFYKHLSSSANLSYVEVPATNCHFGRSVRNAAREKARLLYQARHVVGLKGFHDQVAMYNVSQVRDAIQVAFDKALRCPGRAPWPSKTRENPSTLSPLPPGLGHGSISLPPAFSSSNITA